jgi:hypothetical protein
VLVTRSPRVLRGRARPWVAAVVCATLAVAGCTSSEPPDTATPSRANPVLDGSGGTRNLTFYYAGAQPLEPGSDLSALGDPSVVVTTAKRDEPAAVEAIHGLGAQAYRYVQFFWAPDDEAYEGINLASNPDWSFCRTGDEPVLGRRTRAAGTATDWHFIDANEAAVRAQVLEQLRALKAAGWDGVMFDRGGAALTNASDAAGRPVWSATSSCTDEPYDEGATFADAYVATLALARQAGLRVMLNYGTSPFDPRTPLRPDPADPDCRKRGRDRCGVLRDVWEHVDLVLNEAIAFPRDREWDRTFEANLRSEQDADHGRRTVGLLTTYTLGGERGQNRSTVYYEWSRVRLFDLALAVNTGDGGCPEGGTRSGVCNRYGLYPELTDLRLGEPVGRRPVARDCDGSSAVRCVWTRSYAGGAVLVNVRPRAARVTVEVGDGSCRHVRDVHAQRALAGNRCVTSVRLALPPWSGRPLQFSDVPF